MQTNICPKCYGSNQPQATTCVHCGYSFSAPPEAAVARHTGGRTGLTVLAVTGWTIAVILIVWQAYAAFLRPAEMTPGFERWGICQAAVDPEIDDLLAQAHTLVYYNKYDDARQLYLQVLKRDSCCAEAHVGLSFVHRYTRDETQAFKSCREALKYDSLGMAANWNYGELLWPWRTAKLGEVDSDDERIELSLKHLTVAAETDHPGAAHARMSLSIAYLARQDAAAAREQFCLMGRQQYYPPVICQLARNVLAGADSSAIIFTGGDVDTYSMLCAQNADSVRRDVSVVSMSLLNISSVVKCLRDSFNVPISLADHEIDALETRYDDEKGRVLYVQDQVIRNIIENALEQKRTVYFGLGVSTDAHGEYSDYLSLEGLLYRIDGSKTRVAIDYDKIEANLTTVYDMAASPEYTVWKSNLSPMTNYPYFAYSYYALLNAVMASHYLDIEEDKKAADSFARSFEYYDFLNSQDYISDLIEAWLEKRPDDEEAHRLKAKYIAQII